MVCGCFVKNKLTMFAGPLPFNPLDHLAKTKVKDELPYLVGVHDR
jgi:hypothetical protein